MKRVLILGCTGSIGTSSIDIVRNMKDDFSVCGLSANSSEEKLNNLGNEFNCPVLLTKNKHSEQDYIDFFNKTNPDIIINGIAGAAGLLPSKVALNLHINLALANKETIVMAGPLIKALAKKNNTKIIPVDSEHSAIFNLINQLGKENLDEIIITASGGPFRTFTKEELANVTLEQALNHPTWKMGPKITVDSSTLANKGLEVIEAAYLFDVTADKIKVVVHPQSLVHSLVRAKDGMIYAQISDPDMKHPIFGALSWPENKNNYLKKFDLFEQNFTFYKPRYDDFPLLKYAFNCVEKGNAYTIVFNAANEVAVHAFLDKKIKYLEIADIVDKVLQKNWSYKVFDFDDVFEIDSLAREAAKELL